MKYLTFILIAGMTLGACKSKKKSTDVADQNQTTMKDQVSQEPLNYPLVVSFYSPGDGINHEAHEEFLGYAGDYELALDEAKTPWGREGEVDYCLALTELSDAQKAVFIADVKAMLAETNKVRILENSPCINRR